MHPVSPLAPGRPRRICQEIPCPVYVKICVLNERNILHSCPTGFKRALTAWIWPKHAGVFYESMSDVEVEYENYSLNSCGDWASVQGLVFGRNSRSLHSQNDFTKSFKTVVMGTKFSKRRPDSVWCVFHRIERNVFVHEYPCYRFWNLFRRSLLISPFSDLKSFPPCLAILITTRFFSFPSVRRPHIILISSVDWHTYTNIHFNVNAAHSPSAKCIGVGMDLYHQCAMHNFKWAWYVPNGRNFKSRIENWTD